MKLIKNKIFQMDCVQGMKKYLADSSVDVVVTSPPYNIGIKYNSYSDKKDYENYLWWIKEVAHGIKRVLKPNGSFFFNFGNRPKDQWKAFDVANIIKKYFKLQNTIHWIKSIAIPEKNVNIGHYKPINSNFFINDCHEYIFHFTKTGQIEMDRLAVGVPYKDKSNIGRFSNKDLRCRGNTWHIPYKTVRSQKSHPAAFPVALPEMCIKFHGLKNNGLVLDPFIGIGSTAIAATRQCVHYIGFEIDKEYVQEAKRLLKLEKSKLF